MEFQNQIKLNESEGHLDTKNNDNDVILLPAHTKQATNALALLLFFSFLMFTIPFGIFFGTKHILKDYFHIVGNANMIGSVIAAVISVNIIIGLYVFIAYHEQEYDSEGNLITDDLCSDVNLRLKTD